MQHRWLAAIAIMLMGAPGYARAEAHTWYWFDGTKCRMSSHPPSYEYDQARAAGAREVKTGASQVEIVLPSLKTYAQFKKKGFHFLFFADRQACIYHVREQIRTQQREQQEHRAYEEELKKYRQ